MVDLVLTTFDWVPETPRGFVRDLRVRWALEEAGLPYRVESGGLSPARQPTITHPRVSRTRPGPGGRRPRPRSVRGSRPR
jgi:hypothetical protein